MSEQLYIFGLTGGISTGKSTLCELIREMEPRAVVFDADQSVASLYREPEVIEAIVSYFGEHLRLADGQLDKEILRGYVFQDLQAKRFLEGVFHPKVREECLALLEETSKSLVSRLFVADIPLLFESEFDFGQSANLLVATSKETQVSRLKSRNAWDDVTIKGVLKSQMPIDAKVSLADVVFWNEGPPEVLIHQCRRFLQSLQLYAD